MRAVELLDRLSSLGVTVEVTGDKLRLAPGGATPPELLETVRQYKPQIIALLQQHDGPIPTMSSLAFPQGYRGLPQDPVALGEKVMDALADEYPVLRNPALRRYNVLGFVLSWLLDHYQNVRTGAFDDPAIAQLYESVKAERARLVTTFPRDWGK